MLENKKFAICAICRNEYPYILEWISYQKAIGFDQIFIYDNVSDDGSSELLINLDNIDEITRIHWPRKENIPPQREAYAHFLQNFSHEFDWVMICDIDEFFLPNEGNVKNFVKNALNTEPDTVAIAVPWLLFGSSGLKKQDDRLVIERFIRCDEKPNASVKSIFKPSNIFNMRTHICDILLGKYVDNQFMPAKWEAEPISLKNPVWGHGVIHHYFTKSKEEWDRRRLMSRADRANISFRTLELFYKYDSQVVINKNIYIYLDCVKTKIEFLKNKLLFEDVKVEKIEERSIQIISIDRRWMVGRINTTYNHIKIRILLNDEFELITVANKRLSDGSVGFIINLSWLNMNLKKINVFIIGNATSDIFCSDAFPSQRSMLLNLIKYTPNAEEIIFHRAAKMARTEKGMKNILKANFPIFSKYELYGELIKILIVAYKTQKDVTELLSKFFHTYGKQGREAYNLFINDSYFCTSFLPKL